MAKSTLPVDFKDDILNEQMGGRRKYRMINNPDGTVSFEDVTTYDQTGSNFGQAQINATNQAVNESADKATIIDKQEDLMANTQEGMIAGALAVKELISEQNANISDVESKLRWKEVKSITDVPETANECLFIFKSNVGGSGTICVPYETLKLNLLYTIISFYVNSSTNGYVDVILSETEIVFRCAGYITSCETYKIYYR